MIKSSGYEARLLEALRDPSEAAEYLTAVLADGDNNVFLLALRHVAEAHGGIGKLSGQARLNRVSLYRMLSARGNPELRSLGTLLNSPGLRLAIEVNPRQRRRRAIRNGRSNEKPLRGSMRESTRPA